jgi:hypothetical protein
MRVSRFRCSYCGEPAYYYGDDVAICSSGVRLQAYDIPPGIMRPAFGQSVIVNIAPALQIMQATQNLNDFYNPAFDVVRNGLIRRMK